MAQKDQTPSIPEEVLMSKIFMIRKQKVMLDSDLAELYNVETKQLKRQVRRNPERFPEDFMFELTQEEFENLRSQFGTSKQGGTRYLPMAFTEHGVLMLSSVLNSQTAIRVNIQIIRVFNKMREMLLTHKDLLVKVEQLEQELHKQGKNIRHIFDYLDQFSRQETQPRKRIGFKQKEKKR